MESDTPFSDLERDAREPPTWRRWVAPVLLAALIVGHFLWHVGFVEAAYASPDANGYYGQAGLIVNEGRTGFLAGSPLQYIGGHWLETEDGVFYSRYPAGLPVLLAGAWAVFGESAPFYVDSLLASLTLLFLFLLCRAWVGDGLALLAAIVYAVHPEANHHAHFGFAHTATGFFLIAGLWMLDWWGRAPTRWRAICAGVLLGIVPTIRYAEVVAVVGIGTFLIWHAYRDRSRVRDVGYAVLGASVPISLLAIHNWSAYGAPWRTGYALTNEQTGFGWDWLTSHAFGNYEALMSGGAGLFFAFGIVGMVAMLAKRETRPLAACLVLVIVPVTAVYTAYYWGGGRASLRFFLPVLPLFLLPAMWVFYSMRQSAAARIGALTLAAITVAVGIPESNQRMQRQRRNTHRSAVAADWVRHHVPAGSVIVANRGLNDTLHYYARWKLAESELVGGNGRFDRRGRRPSGRMPGGGGMFGGGPDDPSPMQRGKAEKLRKKYDDLPPADRSLEALLDLVDWAGKADIYWIGSRSEVDRFVADSDGVYAFEKVDEFEVVDPAGTDDDRANDRMGFGMAPGMRGPGLRGPGGRGPGGRGPGGRRPGGAGPGGFGSGISAGRYELFRLQRS